MADVLPPPPPPSTPCTFHKAYIGECKKPSDNGRCSEHEGLTCAVCGSPATKECEYTGFGPLVCGCNLCATCQHAPYDPVNNRFPSEHLTGDDWQKAWAVAKQNLEKKTEAAV